jgi:hypothetical protein
MARQTDEWEWDYGQFAAEPGTTAVAPITQSTTSNSQPISLGSYARPPDALDGIAEGVAQSTLNSLPSTQQPYVQTRNPFTTTEELDPRITPSSPISKTYSDE